MFRIKKFHAAEINIQQHRPASIFPDGVFLRFSQFKEVYKAVEQGHITGSEYIVPMDEVQKQKLSVYQKAFNDRCRSTSGNEVIS